MSAGDKFSERAKNQLLYEYQEGSEVGQMLEQSETNSRTNQEMSRFVFFCKGFGNGWKGNWSKVFDNVVIDIQRLYLSLDGYARVQAIDMQSAHTITEQQLQQKAEKKRGGILGLFG